MAKIQRYAPDTNFYLHARVAGELPWSELTDADTIELIVLDEVMRELDEHKSKGNTRQARRAKAAFKILDPLIDDDEQEVVARKDKPRVIWRLAPLLPSDRAKPAELDPSSADGRIVEQALAVRQQVGDLALLTHDRLPRRLAKTVGLDRQRVPDEWLLPPEPDERDKENAKLKDEIKALKSRAPAIEVELLDGEEPVDRIQGSLVRYLPLSDDFVSDAVEVVERRHPEERTSLPGQVTVVRDASVTKYRNERREWLGRVKDSLEKQPARLTFNESLVELNLVVGNAGSAPAEGFVIEVKIEGALRLVNHHKRKEFLPHIRHFGLPAPPKLERMSSFFGQQPTIDGLDRRIFDHLKPPPLARDPNSFYWDYSEDKIFCAGATGTCGDFRHQMGQFELPILLTVPFESDGDPVGCLRIRCSAKNLPEPIEWVFPIRLQFDWKDSEEPVKQMLHDS